MSFSNYFVSQEHVGTKFCACVYALFEKLTHFLNSGNTISYLDLDYTELMISVRIEAFKYSSVRYM